MSRIRTHLAVPHITTTPGGWQDHDKRPACQSGPTRQRTSWVASGVSCAACRLTEAYEDAERSARADEALTAMASARLKSC